MNILRLKEIMEEKGISGKDLAERVKVSQNSISNIVMGRTFPKPELLLALAQVLDVDVRELLISTKSKDLTDPRKAITEIKKIIREVRLD